MEGIAELFAQYSEPDEFVVQAQLELFGWHERADKRENERLRYRVMSTIPAWRERLNARTRERLRAYEKQRRATDPAYLARRRETKRLSMQRARARQRMEARAA